MKFLSLQQGPLTVSVYRYTHAVFTSSPGHLTPASAVMLFVVFLLHVILYIKNKRWSSSSLSPILKDSG